MVVRTIDRQRDLTDREAQLLALYRGAAERLDFAPNTDDLADALGVSNGGTISEMTQRLALMGHIEVESFQRGRQICFPDGICTARPLGKTSPHWRSRPRDVPTPSIATVRERKPDIVGQIMTWAAKRGVLICDALADLVYVGWEVERERG